MLKHHAMVSAVALGAAGLPVLAGMGSAEFYGDIDTFLGDGVEVIDVNAFDEIVAGSMDSYSYSVGAYSYTITSLNAADPGFFNHDGILAGAGASEEWIQITFTGADVYVVGGNFWGIQDSGEPGGAYFVMELDDGSLGQASDTGAHNFRGVISETAISSIRIGTSRALPDITAHMAIDNLLIGNVVPATGVFPLLAAAGLATTRRRRA